MLLMDIFKLPDFRTRDTEECGIREMRAERSTTPRAHLQTCLHFYAAKLMSGYG